MTPLEQILLAALKLRRATSWPFVAPPYGLGLTADTMGGMAEHTARNTAADKAVDEAIAAAEGGGVTEAARVGMPVLYGATDGPVLGTVKRQSGRMVEIDLSAAGVAFMEDIVGREVASLGLKFDIDLALVGAPEVYVLVNQDPRNFGALATMSYAAGVATCKARAESDFRAAGYAVNHKNVKHESEAARLKGYRGRWPNCISLVPRAPLLQNNFDGTVNTGN